MVWKDEIWRFTFLLLHFGQLIFFFVYSEIFISREKSRSHFSHLYSYTGIGSLLHLSWPWKNFLRCLSASCSWVSVFFIPNRCRKQIRISTCNPACHYLSYNNRGLDNVLTRERCGYMINLRCEDCSGYTWNVITIDSQCGPSFIDTPSFNRSRLILGCWNCQSWPQPPIRVSQNKLLVHL